MFDLDLPSIVCIIGFMLLQMHTEKLAGRLAVLCSPSKRTNFYKLPIVRAINAVLLSISFTFLIIGRKKERWSLALFVAQVLVYLLHDAAYWALVTKDMKGRLFW